MITKAQIAHSPIGAGDAGVILRADGSFEIFNTHTDLRVGAELSPVQEDQGRKLRAIAIMLSIKQLLDMMDEFAEDPAVAGTIINMGHCH